MFVTIFLQVKMSDVDTRIISNHFTYLNDHFKTVPFSVLDTDVYIYNIMFRGIQIR